MLILGSMANLIEKRCKDQIYLFPDDLSYLGLLSFRDGELVVDPEARVEPDLGGHADLEVDVGANLLKVLPIGHDARPVAVVIPRVS